MGMNDCGVSLIGIPSLNISAAAAAERRLMIPGFSQLGFCMDKLPAATFALVFTPNFRNH